LALISLVIAALLVLVAALAPWVAPYGAGQTDYGAQNASIGSPGHLLGTDALGRDLLSRMIYGLRTALLVAFFSQLITVVVALAVGVTAGYLGGRADSFLMATTDVMYAFPTYLFAVLLVTVFGRGFWTVVIAIAIADWVTQARLSRAQVLTLKQREYVEAARSILPNAIGPILVATSFAIPAAITAEAGLSLLGLGIANMPSWGTMLNEGVRAVASAPHLVLAPALAFAVTLLTFTWIGDGLRDAFDVTQEDVR
jgi:ABC-type dipeptide/oligopeptide/nickel transport system permease subunit